uniref:Cilia- and flagella-associated protein 157 n=1 Tax=Panagrellus redivivus TaxID=6233 RepID=A0A7E4WC27_PANRE
MLETDFDNLKKQITDSATAIVAASPYDDDNAVDLLTVEREVYQQQIADRETEIKRLTEKCTFLTNSLQQSRENLQEVGECATESAQKVESLVNELRQSEAIRLRVERDLEKAQTELLQLHADREVAEARLTALSQVMSRREKDEIKLRTELADKSTRVAVKTATVDRLGEFLSTIGCVLVQLKAEIREMKAGQMDIMNECFSTKQEVYNMYRETAESIGKLKNDHVHLIEELHAEHSMNLALKSQLEAERGFNLATRASSSLADEIALAKERQHLLDTLTSCDYDDETSSTTDSGIAPSVVTVISSVKPKLSRSNTLPVATIPIPVKHHQEVVEFSTASTLGIIFVIFMYSFFLDQNCVGGVVITFITSLLNM